MGERKQGDENEKGLAIFFEWMGWAPVVGWRTAQLERVLSTRRFEGWL
jgi:hypothetical protein